MIIVSTPRWYEYVLQDMDRCRGKRNSYIPIEVHWSEVPMVMKMEKETIANTSEQQFQTEFE